MIFIYFRFVAPVVMAPVVLCVYGGYVTCFFDPVVADMLDTRSVCVCVCVGGGGGGASVYTGALGMKI